MVSGGVATRCPFPCHCCSHWGQAEGLSTAEYFETILGGTEAIWINDLIRETCMFRISSIQWWLNICGRSRFPCASGVQCVYIVTVQQYKVLERSPASEEGGKKPFVILWMESVTRFTHPVPNYFSKPSISFEVALECNRLSSNHRRQGFDGDRQISWK